MSAALAQPDTRPSIVTALLASTTCTIPVACEALGIGKSVGYELAKRGEFPVPVLHLGRRLVVPTRPLLRLLELA